MTRSNAHRWSLVGVEEVLVIPPDAANIWLHLRRTRSLYEWRCLICGDVVEVDEGATPDEYRGRCPGPQI